MHKEIAEAKKSWSSCGPAEWEEEEEVLRCIAPFDRSSAAASAHCLHLSTTDNDQPQQQQQQQVAGAGGRIHQPASSRPPAMSFYISCREQTKGSRQKSREARERHERKKVRGIFRRQSAD